MDLITPNAYLAKVDLSQAYRSVKIHPTDYSVTGLKWKFSGDSDFTYMVDSRLPFGARKSPTIFNELSTAVRVIMAQKGHPTVVSYLDDFLIVSKTYKGCQDTINVLLGLLRKLGFWINYNKLDGPRRRLVFLGIVLDTTNMTLELPESKMQAFYEDIRTMYSKSKCTKKQLQSLVGKLNWATQCVYGGRFHLRRLIDTINKLQFPWHRTRITSDMKADMEWWLVYMHHFNGKTPHGRCPTSIPCVH